MRKKLYIAIAASFMSAPLAADIDLVDWDNDGDGLINDSEYNAYVSDYDLHGPFDANDDDLIDETEWGEFTVDFDDEFGEHHDVDWDYEYGAWDVNDDMYLDEDEFNDGLFGIYDEDEDGLWGDEEWEAFDDSEWWEI